jgi:hypothetical protein
VRRRKRGELPNVQKPSHPRRLRRSRRTWRLRRAAAPCPGNHRPAAEAARRQDATREPQLSKPIAPRPNCGQGRPNAPVKRCPYYHHVDAVRAGSVDQPATRGRRPGGPGGSGKRSVHGRHWRRGARIRRVSAKQRTASEGARRRESADNGGRVRNRVRAFRPWAKLKSPARVRQRL